MTTDHKSCPLDSLFPRENPDNPNDIDDGLLIRVKCATHICSGVGYQSKSIEYCPTCKKGQDYWQDKNYNIVNALKQCTPACLDNWQARNL